ncbi:MAG: apolipoprotein N-acyltransferase, partial [Candidatus Omnitrophota bacterium]
AINVIIYTLADKGIKKSGWAVIISFVLISCVSGYGYFRLNTQPDAKNSVKVSLIQGNIAQHIKWDPELRGYIWSQYSALTEAAAKEGPDLVIWPETSLPGYMEDEELFRDVTTLARETGSTLLIGAPSYSEQDDKIYNSAFLIGKNGDIAGRYDKLHLVPFGEYIPFEDLIGFIRGFVDKPIGAFEKGKERKVFKLEDGTRFSVLICFEDIFAGLVREFVKGGADFLVNTTNDAWFMKSPAPYQHAQSSVFRAVENRVPVVRAANTGLSCFIDRTGRIFDSVNISGDEIFISGFKTASIDIIKSASFYTRFGDLFILICALAVIIASFVFRKARL